MTASSDRGGAGCLAENTLFGLVRGDLSDDELARAEGHLDDCTSCRALAAEAMRAGSPAGPTRGPAADAEGPAPTPAPRALTAGTMVGRYKVLSLIGAGGMSTVYAAWDPELDRKV